MKQIQSAGLSLRTIVQTVLTTGAPILIAAVLCASNALADASLYAASPYDVFVLNNFTDQYSDLQGGLAAGGTINLTGFSLAQGLTASQAANDFQGGYTLVAGGLLNANSGRLYAGNAYGYAANVNSNFTISPGTLTTGTPQVIDFADAGVQLRALSASLAGMTTTAGDSCVLLYGTTTCTAAANNLNIINVTDPSVLATNIQINLTGANATLVINVPDGSDFVDNGGFSVSGNGGATGGAVLFNYYQATSLTLGNASFQASLLAPLASVSATSGGNFDGTLVANNFTGQLQFDNTDPFTGDLGSPTPEPASTMLAGAGLILISLLSNTRAGSRP
jgi:choice-of-anchor A domain-containing protein